MNYPINILEVIRSFLAANEAKRVALLLKDKGLSPEEYFQKVLLSLKRTDEESLRKMVSDKRRLERFFSHRWFKKQVALKYIGGWPHIGDLSKEWCQGSVVDVAHQVSSHKDFNCSSIKRIEGITTIIDEVLSFFPPILVQGGEIRKERNLLYLPFDADDGSHRCVAAVLAGKKTIKAYIGVM